MNKHPKIKAAKTRDGKVKLKAVVKIKAAHGDKKLPTFHIDLYSGAVMDLDGFFEPVVIDLQGDIRIAPQGVKVLLDHQTSQIVGHVDADGVDVSDSGITLDGVVSGTGPAAQEVVANAANGFPWEASAGGDPTRIEFIESGDSVNVNGQELAGPLNVVRALDLNEGSFVAFGADRNTAAEVAARKKERQAMNFQKWLKARGITEGDLSDDKKSLLKASYDAEQKQIKADAAADDPPADDPPADDPPADDPPADDPPADPVDADTPAALVSRAKKQIRAAASGEMKRIAAIKDIDGISAHPKLHAQAIDEEWTRDRTELAVLRAARPQASNQRTGGTDEERETSSRVLQASLCFSAGIHESKVKTMGFDDDIIEAAMTSKNRGATIQSAMESVMLYAGEGFSGSRKSREFIRQVLKASQKLEAAGFSSLSLPGILGNTANKAMVAAYTAVNTIWQQFCAIRSHQDFKTNTRYRLDSLGAFKKVAQSGELKHVGLDEGSFENSVETYGAIIALTRQTMINDDLGQFLQIPTLIGRMSALRVEEAVFVLLLANTGSFFAAGNNNLFTGAGSVLDIAGMTQAEQGFADMVDSNGKPVLINGKTLVTGTALKVAARQLFTELNLNESTTTDKPKIAVNPHQGKFDPFASPYVNNTNVTDQDDAAIANQSATRWYLFADPADRAAMAVAFLNGQAQPVIESAETSFETLGVQWRGYHDFGVGFEDPVAAISNAGV